MRAPGILGSCFLAAALLAWAANADADPTRALVRRLHRPGHAHPLAGRSGKIAFTARLPEGVSAASLGLVPVAPGFGAARVAPDDVAGFLAARPGLVVSATPPRRAWLDVSQGWVNGAQLRSNTGRDGRGVVVGVVDTGLAVDHPDLRNADGTTRVAWMLGAGAARGVHADLESTFGCSDPAGSACAVWSAHDIDTSTEPRPTSLRDPDGHGTHVTSIAAGNGGPAAKYVGMAPGATIIMAAPSAPGAGFVDSDILNGVRFIFDRADNLPTCPDGLSLCDPDAYTCDAGDACDAATGHCKAATATACAPQACEREACKPTRWPCVVNLSLGGDYGGHDGTSFLEQGIAELVGNQPGHVVTVAAGNSGAVYDLGDGLGPYGIHTEARVAPDSRVRVPLLLPAAASGQVFVWVRGNAGDALSVGIEGPGGETWLSPVAAGDDAGYDTDDGKTTASIINDEVDANTQITAQTNSAVVVLDGAWDDQSVFAVTLEGHGLAELWITSGGDIGPDRSVGALFERSLVEGTISVPATSTSVVGVGCTINRGAWQPAEGPAIELTDLGGAGPPSVDGACYFSSAGPAADGTPKPEISAPGGFVAAAMAADADPRKTSGGLFDTAGCPSSTKCYVVDDDHAIAVGTSMSSPHAAGVVALLLQGDPTLTQAQISDALVAGARRPSGASPHDYQIGAGVVDGLGALTALEPETGVSQVDLARSWYVLSAGFAHTDASIPVWGTVELRTADGQIAMGVLGSALTLTVDHGVVVQPITKVAPGLFQFSFTGEAGGAGQPVTVDVAYGGASLGKRTLAVGTDAWNTDLAVDATSGACTCSAVGGDGAPSGAIGVAVAALGLAFERRRARYSRAMSTRR